MIIAFLCSDIAPTMTENAGSRSLLNKEQCEPAYETAARMLGEERAAAVSPVVAVDMPPVFGVLTGLT